MYGDGCGSMEMEVASLMGKDGKEREALCGRVNGPVYVQRCALSDEIAGSRKTTAVSRAWRRSAGWLSDIARAGDAWETMVCRWKVGTYKHPPPDKYKATPQQLESFARFLA